MSLKCPVCPGQLDVVPGEACCSECTWKARGDVRKIVQAAQKLVPPDRLHAPAPKPSKELPELLYGSVLQSTEPDLPPYLVEGLLHEGGKMVLGGGSKSFKTWCLIDLAISVSLGIRWWNRPTNRGVVVYLNLEVQSGFFHKRLKDIAKARGVEIDDNLLSWNLRGHCVDHSELLPKLAEKLKGMAVKMIILDPTYKVMTKSENAQEEVAALMNSIERLAIATGATVVFGSHFAKGNAAGKEAMDRISGSGVFARDPDTIMTLTRHEDDDVFVVDSVLRNSPPIPSFAVRWLFPLMAYEPDADVTKLKGADPARAPKVKISGADVANILRGHGGMLRGGRAVPGSLPDAVREVAGIGIAKAERACMAAVESGDIETTQESDGKNRYTRIYRLKAPTN